MCHTGMHSFFLAMKIKSLIILTRFQVSLQAQSILLWKPLNFEGLANVWARLNPALRGKRLIFLHFIVTGVLVMAVKENETFCLNFALKFWIFLDKGLETEENIFSIFLSRDCTEKTSKQSPGMIRTTLLWAPEACVWGREAIAELLSTSYLDEVDHGKPRDNCSHVKLYQHQPSIRTCLSQPHRYTSVQTRLKVLGPQAPTWLPVMCVLISVPFQQCIW